MRKHKEKAHDGRRCPESGLASAALAATVSARDSCDAPCQSELKISAKPELHEQADKQECRKSFARIDQRRRTAKHNPAEPERSRERKRTDQHREHCGSP